MRAHSIGCFIAPATEADCADSISMLQNNPEFMWMFGARVLICDIFNYAIRWRISSRGEWYPLVRNPSKCFSDKYSLNVSTHRPPVMKSHTLSVIIV